MCGRLSDDSGLLLSGMAFAAARRIGEIWPRCSEPLGTPADFHVELEVAPPADADGRRARRAASPRTTGPDGAMDDGTCARDWTGQCPDGAARSTARRRRRAEADRARVAMDGGGRLRRAPLL